MTDIPSWARVGATVLCVDDDPRIGAWNGDAPVLGAVYTISRVIVTGLACPYSFHLLELSRASTAVQRYGGDVGYALDRFRPLITEQDDIEAHFRALLDTKSPVNIDA